ncbi:efflux RND transporter periplasmic adaptor subunit [Shewanella sp. SR44-3]|uniref:efflux RND transporter periplasmic adaptor subunit n=2 Tax=Shewanella TaxID=22 RepID=UPI0015F8149C|nr:HlyD family efflux transporter periplasmic adaptor subunit [Shewanella sp. SR44-3]MBB1269943.1 HlyD family efflux transporter periplasmic adaptor subunit [Shewanella sp. SR44-3]
MFNIPKDRNYSKKLKILPFLLAAIVLFIVIFATFTPQAFSIATSNSEHLMSEVEYSSMTVMVSGYGKLVPKIQRGVNAISSGHIVEVVLKPGNIVNKGDVILRLNNPKLLRAMETSELELLEEKSHLQQVMAESRQILEDQLGAIRLANVRLALSKAELTANETLKESHVISALELHKAKVEWEKEDAILQMETSRYNTLQQTRQSINQAALYRLEKAQKQYEMFALEVNQLSITASMDGMLTELADDLEIGRHLDEGQAVGMIADLSSYYARISITANDAEFVNPKLAAKVSIKGIDMPGFVSRVEPSVTNGSVEIDISFTGDLPTSVRPNIDVNAIIEVAEHKNTLIADRPVGVIRGHREYPMFILNEKLELFEKRQVLVGDIYGDKAQVIAGLTQGEQLLLQVPTHLANREEFTMGDLYD